MEIPREARKQIFITNMEAFFTSDLATAQFGGADLWRRTRGTPGAEGDGYEMMEEYEYEMMMEMERMGGQYGQYYPGGMFGLGGEAAEEKMPGFVVTVAGYSPYGKSKNDLHKLIDPSGVENKPGKGGLVTRLLHLDDDGNSPFEVYKKTDPNQFKLEIEPVDLAIQMPAGIGIRDVRYKPTPPGSTQEESAEWVLIDPMTKELISKIAEWEENGRPKLYRGQQVYTVNDHWFVLNVKFVWRDAPESVKAVAPTFLGMPGMLGRPGMVRPAAPQSPPSGGGSNLTTGIE
jgi:hypothetical protein